MNVLNTQEQQSYSQAQQRKLLGSGMDRLVEYAHASARLKQTLHEVKTLGDESVSKRIERLEKQLESFEPSVTVIGQIKSGKTSLVNALIGAPDLLPSDVNPWTSVVTSLHLHPEAAGVNDKASFQFFDTKEWDRLVTGGGRMGELASRAGADAELQKIKEQVEDMRRKSQERLGRKFELLLGQRRDYGHVSKSLIERFVCLGDDLEDLTSGSDLEDQGRFADITKSADLTLSHVALPIRLCLRDTPGVNDTFMMREQITIRAIRDSKLCVVILSANQALSTTDMALIRLISNVKSRDIIIFVNRVDELSDPVRQVPQIKSGIEDTLRRHNGPDAVVLFGSALWANHALAPDVQGLPPSSLSALTMLGSGDAHKSTTVSPEAAWRASGLPVLLTEISKRIVEGAGAVLLSKTAASGQNLVSGLAAANRVSVAREVSGIAQKSPSEARALLHQLASRQATSLVQEYDSLIRAAEDRMARAQESFLDRATASLIVHLEAYGEDSPWTYDPSGLRVLLSSSHKVFARKSRKVFEAIADETVVEASRIFKQAFLIEDHAVQIIAPSAPDVPSPVSLGRTIALDLSSSWWRKWWLQRRGYKAYAEGFRELIRSETETVISDLIDDFSQGVKQNGRAAFEAFTNEQFAVFETLHQGEARSGDGTFGIHEEAKKVDRQEVFKRALSTLGEYLDQ